MSAPQPSEDIDDDVNDILGTQGDNGTNGNKEATAVVTSRARRRREEAVRRLVGDVHRRPDARGNTESHEWLVASTVATALERGLDKDLHSELVHEAKENAARIGQVCHDHSDAFLASVGRVVALGIPSGDLSEALDQAHETLQETSGNMLHASSYLEYSKQANQRARTLSGMVTACRNVAVLLERARKQASLGRPRAALDAVDEARNCLTAPVSALLLGTTQYYKQQQQQQQAQASMDDPNAPSTPSTVETLEETPFGKRAMTMLPKIENEVLMGARRGLNRWFLSLRSGGDGAKSGRAVLRKCAHSMAVGPGQLGLGGHLPPSYIWRAKVADNLLARLDQTGKVARAVRLGYWFERDAPKEAERLETSTVSGMERRAEAFAAAFGWYRCWDENAQLLVDIAELNIEGQQSGGLSGSRHGSRHGKNKGNLHFRGSQSSRGSTQRRELSLKAGGGARTSMKSSGGRSAWAVLLTPSILFENSSTRTEDDSKLMGLPESVHPVRRAELAFNLLGRSDEFVQYYEQNRFGDVKIGGSNKDEDKANPVADSKNETRSSLSSLTGDDVSVGTDRVFFAKSLPHLCSSVVGFSAVEAALELGFFSDEDDEEQTNGSKDNKSTNTKTATPGNSVSRFRDSSARYERSLVAELGTLLRGRAIGASLAELCRASCLMAAFRSALKVVHPSSSTRRNDKELLAMDIDIVMTALKVAQDEMLKVTKKIAMEDRKEPLVVTTTDHMQSKLKKKDTIPDEELVGIPFGLSVMKQKSSSNLDGLEDHGRGRNTRQTRREEYYTFSKSVPEVLRAIHARTIACAAFALSQEELGQVFSQKKGSGAAGYVLDCLEECISVAAVGMQDGDAILEEGSVSKAVQTMANIAALQHSLPRLFGTLMRGMCHVGLIRNDQLSDTFVCAETALKGADKSCDKHVGNMYSLVYEICRSKIDSHINFALDNFQWISKAARDMPNAYCEGLIQYLRMTFAHLGPMDEGSRFGLHFSCCGHVAERLVKLLTDPPVNDHHHHAQSSHSQDEETLPPITKIDAYGLKNLALDVAEFQRFADETDVPQLSECFNELKGLTRAMIDKDLPRLLRRENAAERRQKYPFVSMEKLGNILEKYVGMGLGDKLIRSSTKHSDILTMEKKEVHELLRLARSQER